MRGASLFLLGLLSSAGVATAQVPVSRADTTRASRGLVEAQPVITRGQPGSFQVVAVPLPARFQRDSAVSFLVEPVGNASILGRKSGGFTGDADRSVLVTIGIPRAAAAGMQLAARVVFASGEDSVEVPVMIDVPPMRAVAISAPEEISARAAGGRAELVVTVTNRGNAPDTLRLTIAVPNDWTPLRQQPAPIVLAAAGSAREVVRLEIPRTASTGDHYARVAVSGSDSARAEQLVRIEVGQQQSSVAPPGPTLTTSLGSVSATGGTAGIAQFSLNGALTRVYSIDARLAVAPTLQSGQIRGLARVGAFMSRPQFALWSERWRLDAGSAVASLNDLVGLNAGGDGLTFAYADENKSARVIAARPNRPGGGHLIGGTAAVEAHGLLWSAGLSSLAAGPFGKLNAGSVGTQWQHQRVGTLSGDVGYRSSAQESGLAAGATYERAEERGSISARLVHAPGGSSAFARATDEGYLSLTRSLHRKFDLAVTGFASRDRNSSFSSITSKAWSLTPSFKVNELTTARLDARGSAYSARGESSFGNGETRFIAGINSGTGKFYYSADAGVNWLSRTLTVAEGDFVSRAPQLEAHGSTTYVTSFGRLQAEGLYSRSTAEVAVMPDQHSLTVRAEQLRLARLPGNVYFDAEVGHHRWAGERALNTMRIGSTMQLPQNMQLRVALERNPLLAGSTSGSPWLVALKVDRRVGLPRLRLGSAAGRVFQDLNGNGIRDAGESGVAQVMVKQGGARATSDADGNFVFWERARGPITVEAASIPFGWLVNQPRGDARDIALVPTSSIVVQLQLGTAERVRGIDITPAVVIARDEQGRTWQARRTAPETAVFDALPVGRYTLEVDFGALAEPLRTEQERYPFTAENRGSVTITIPVMGRPLRFKKDGRP